MAKSTFELAGRRVFVAGHRGMVGSAIVRRLGSEHCEVLTADRNTVDLRNQQMVHDWVTVHKPEVVIIAAAKVGGIFANSTLPAQFIYDNLIIAANLIEASHQCGASKLLFLGSSCIYPRLAPQPMTEDALLAGPLEPTNEPYAIAKIAGIKLAEAYRRQYGNDYISAMPTNLYGPGDNYHPEYSHVVPALIRRFHEAKVNGASRVVVWGTGQARREFLYVDDLANACIFLLKCYSDFQHVNVGVGSDVTIAQLAHKVAEVTGFKGEISFDPSRPDGTPRKLLDVSRLSTMGWHATTTLEDGLRQAYRAFVKDHASAGGGPAS